MRNRLAIAQTEKDYQGQAEDDHKPADIGFGTLEATRRYQKLISQLDLIPDEQARVLAARIQAGIEYEDAVAYCEQHGLTDDEDYKVWAAATHESKAAREALVMANLRLVAYIARLTMGWVPFGKDRIDEQGKSVFKGVIFKDLSRFAKSVLPLDDRIQAGTEGLIKAARSYDPDNRSGFVNYAFYAIEGAIANAIIKNSRWYDVKDENGQTSRLLSDTEIPSNEYDRTSDDFAEEIVEQMENEDLADRALARLRDRERDVLAMRYGIATGVPATLRDIGEMIGRAPETVRHIEIDALRRLKEDLVSEDYRKELRRKAKRQAERRRQRKLLKIYEKWVKNNHLGKQRHS